MILFSLPVVLQMEGFTYFLQSLFPKFCLAKQKPISNAELGRSEDQVYKFFYCALTVVESAI